MTPLEILVDRGFKPDSNLNYCTPLGVDYYIGYSRNVAAIVAIIEDEEYIYSIDKIELLEMVYNAKVKGIDEVILYTNYGLELHSRYDTPEEVGLNQIMKIDNEGYNQQKLKFQTVKN